MAGTKDGEKPSVIVNIPPPPQVAGGTEEGEVELGDHELEEVVVVAPEVPEEPHYDVEADLAAAKAEFHPNVGQRVATQVLNKWGAEEADVQARLDEIPPTPHEQAKSARQRWAERMAVGYSRAKAKVASLRKPRGPKPTLPEEAPKPIPPSAEPKPARPTFTLPKLPSISLPKPPRVDWEGLKRPFRLTGDPVARRVWIAIGVIVVVGTTLAIAIANTEAIARWSRETNAEFAAWDQATTAELTPTLRRWQQELDQIPSPDPTKDWEAAKEFFRDLASR